MSEAVLDQAIERIADGLSVDWGAFERATSKEHDWAKSLRVLNDIVNLHRHAAVDFEQTTMASTEASATRPEAISETWGRYKLASKVGEGSYGSVYRAWDSELERDVAIKILHRRVGDTRLKERLLQEGRALAKIRHANVVNVLGVEAHGDRVGLCMEFVEGKTLADVVRTQGKLSAREAVLIGEDLCRALSAVHRSGYIHRDVKAKNVMRDDSGRTVLMDFGTGRAESSTPASDRAGTPLYMAPEVLEGAAASPCSDVYSLGVLLYHLVTSEYPVDARSVDQLREEHANRRHRWLSERRPDLPVAFMQVVERAIALDPEERYANASELLGALSNLKIGVEPWVWRIAKPALWVAALLTAVGMTGVLTSSVYNLALQRADFADDGLWDYLVWGRRASFTPVAMVVVTTLTFAAIHVMRRLIVAMSAHARRLESVVRGWLGRAVHRLRLDNAQVAACCVILLTASALIIAVWNFSPLILALVGIPSSNVDDFVLLSPDFTSYHNRYRQVFVFMTIGSVALWYPIMRLVRKGDRLRAPLWVGGAVVIFVQLVFLQFPYRLLYASLNEPVEAVQWQDQRCYVIGERAGEMLLFCPSVGPPHNRVVKRNQPGVHSLGVRESPFSRLIERPRSSG